MLCHAWIHPPNDYDFLDFLLPAHLEWHPATLALYPFTYRPHAARPLTVATLQAPFHVAKVTATHGDVLIAG